MRLCWLTTSKYAYIQYVKIDSVEITGITFQNGNYFESSLGSTSWK